MPLPIRGTGKLTGDGNVECPVGFDLQGIVATSGVPGLPPEGMDVSYSGKVWALDKTPLQEGYYKLLTDEGAEYRVQNLGGFWSVLD